MGFLAPTPHPTSPHLCLHRAVIQGAASSRGRCDGATILARAWGVRSCGVGLGGRGGAGAEVAPGLRSARSGEGPADCAGEWRPYWPGPWRGGSPAPGLGPAALLPSPPGRPGPQSRACRGTPPRTPGRREWSRPEPCVPGAWPLLAADAAPGWRRGCPVSFDLGGPGEVRGGRAPGEAGPRRRQKGRCSQPQQTSPPTGGQAPRAYRAVTSWGTRILSRHRAVKGSVAFVSSALHLRQS